MRRVVFALLLVAACEPSWEGKDGWRRCAQAIAADRPPPTCAAMHMCANEAPLDPTARARLVVMMVDARCPPP